jgi:putative transposase
MSRESRLVEPGVAFHVTARGNYRQDVFIAADDRTSYLKLLSLRAEQEGLDLLGWCLMSNHIHLLVVPTKQDSLARALKRTQGEYAQAVNRRCGRRAGHLWQSRFYSCPLNGDAVWTVLRYIELNPVRAGLVATAETSLWSSASIHCGLAQAPPFLSLTWWSKLWTPERWRSVLAIGPDERQAEAIRQATQRGMPLGDDAFCERVATQAGRALKARPVGRPPTRTLAGPDDEELACGNTA